MPWYGLPDDNAPPADGTGCVRCRDPGAKGKGTRWVTQALEPFRVIFVALFFVSIDLLVDISFIGTHSLQVILLVTVVLASNTLINGVILRLLGLQWQQSLCAGAMLAQIGESSFVLAAVGLKDGIFMEVAYQYIIAVIALSLLISPFWISAARRLFRVEQIVSRPEGAPE